MNKKENLSTPEAAKFLGLSIQRVKTKIDYGHFSGAYWCECGRTRMVPMSELEIDKKKREERKK